MASTLCTIRGPGHRQPMVGLTRGIRMVKKLLRDLAQKGTTIFMSTHTLGLLKMSVTESGSFTRGVDCPRHPSGVEHRAQIEEGILKRSS